MSPCPFCVECPHCGQYIEIVETNCLIFRHAARMDGTQLLPHATKEEIERARPFLGCGMPFRLVLDQTAENGYRAEVCDYI